MTKYKSITFGLILFMSIPVLSADATRKTKFNGTIIFDSASEGFNIFKIDGSIPEKDIQLTRNTKEAYEDYVEPKWSPDGKQIAYILKEVTLDRQNIYLMNYDGKNKSQLTTFEKEIIFDLDWPNAKEITFTYNPNVPNKSIVRKAINIQTRQIRDIRNDFLGESGCSPAIPSPNDSFLLCMESLSSAKDRMTLYHKLNKTKKMNKTFSYYGTLYEKSTERIVEEASRPLWSKDSSRFAVLLDNKSLLIFDNEGKEVLKKKVTLCDNEPCLKNWPATSDQVIYSCNCAAEGMQESIYLLDTKTMKRTFISEGQHPDLYIGK